MVSGNLIAYEWQSTVYIYDLLNQELVDTFSVPTDSRNFNFDGNIITWVSFGLDVGDIFYYDTATGSKTAITNGEFVYDKPRVSGNKIVFEKKVDNDKVEVLVHDIETAEMKLISPIGGVAQRPDISGNKAVYTLGNSQVMMVDVDTDETQVIASSANYYDFPRISGDYVVWNEGLTQSSDKSDVYGYNFQTQELRKISAVNSTIYEIEVEGNQIVWGTDMPLLGTKNVYYAEFCSVNE